MPKPDKYKHQKNYSANQEADGLARVTMWVPELMRDKALAYAKKLRVKHYAQVEKEAKADKAQQTKAF